MLARIRIGTRPSALALAQAEIVKQQLEVRLGPDAIEIRPIRTTGDKMTTGSLAQVGGKGLFIKELEQALADGVVDVAVHSMKDMPALISPQFRIAAVPERESSCDVLVTRTGIGWKALAPGARLGTSSTRRRFEALRLRPDLDVLPLRGNVDTRLRRLEAGDFDALVLAMAGLKRLRRCEELKLSELDEADFVPSAGQGALAIEALAGRRIGGSAELEDAVSALSNCHALAEVAAERAFLAAIGASCVSPLGAKGTAGGKSLRLRALLFSSDGSKSLLDEMIESSVDLPRIDPDHHPARVLGTALGNLMLSQGAAEFIQRE